MRFQFQKSAIDYEPELLLIQQNEKVDLFSFFQLILEVWIEPLCSRKVQDDQQ